MQKSEIYEVAMRTVVDSIKLGASVKLEIVERLLDDKRLAEWNEKRDAEEAEAKKAQEAAYNTVEG